MTVSKQLVMAVAAGLGFALLTAYLALVQASALAAPLAPDAVTAGEYARGFSSPVDIASTGLPGDQRLFVVERGGAIRIITPTAGVTGTVLATPFLDINGIVTDAGGEQGLLGLAFSPEYSTTRQFFVYYVDNGGDLQLSRFERHASNANLSLTTETPILKILHNTAHNHNGGDLAFGPDGYLYLAPGDGGNTPEKGQQLNTLLGKVLRIDVTGVATYTIPATNPFTATAELDEIWAYGLRNPFRFSFDRQTGDFYIADVGAGLWEEVSYTAAGTPGGVNYGWRCYEGNHFHNVGGCSMVGNYTMPKAVYCNSGSGGCSNGGQAVIGGFVYRGTDYPGMQGYYFYADSYSNRFWAMQPGTWAVTLLGISNVPNPGSFGEDVNGELYVAALGNGRVYRLQGSVAAVLETPMWLPHFRR